MLTGHFRKRHAEKVDIVVLEKKNAVPGNAIPERIVQTQLESVIVRSTEASQAEPTVTKNMTYQCYLFEGVKPEVSQIVKRSTGEKLTILTEPEQIRETIFFDCQHYS